MLDLLLGEPATAEFITRKLWREFVSPDPDETAIRRIAQRFRDSRYDIKVALYGIFTSDAFYDTENRAVLAPGFRVLDHRERTILHLRFFKGLTQSQIAAQVGISQMHVSRLIRRSLEKIREEIGTEEEIESRAAEV